jgi:hypothetical protein
MAETSAHNPEALWDNQDELQQLQQLQEDSPQERHTHEATELSRIRSNYSRVSSHRHQVALVTAKKPVTFLEHIAYDVKTFWGRQISVVVAHDTCRDHLGTRNFSTFDILHMNCGPSAWPSETCLPRCNIICSQLHIPLMRSNCLLSPPYHSPTLSLGKNLNSFMPIARYSGTCPRS